MNSNTTGMLKFVGLVSQWSLCKWIFGGDYICAAKPWHHCLSRHLRSALLTSSPVPDFKMHLISLQYWAMISAQCVLLETGFAKDCNARGVYFCVCCCHLISSYMVKRAPICHNTTILCFLLNLLWKPCNLSLMTDTITDSNETSALQYLDEW